MGMNIHVNRNSLFTPALICMCQQIYSREELTMISDLCKSHDVVCVSDEVYEWMTFDGNQHIKIGEL